MNAIQLAKNAYAPANPTTRPPRAIEAQLLTAITSRLSRTGTDFATKVAAVHENRRLWNTLAIDVADQDNSLATHLRAQIFFLAEFTEQHSRRFLKGEVDLDALIDINTAVLRGLNGQGVN